MSTPSNASILETAASLLNLGDVDGFVDTLFAPDSVDHDPAPGQGAGREGYRSFFHTLVAAFPDANFEPVVEVADDRHVAVAYTLTGTHRGDFRGVAATGKYIGVRGVQIGRFENGQIVERWGSTDELGILEQIGASPAGGQASVLDKLDGAFAAE